MRLENILIAVVFLLSGFKIREEQVTRWQFTYTAAEAKPGKEAVLIFTANIEKGWYLYSSDFNLESGPNPTRFDFTVNDTYQILDGVVPERSEKKFEPAFEGEVTYFRHKAVFRQKILFKSKHPVIEGSIVGQVCNDKKGLCLPFVQRFNFSNKPQ